MLTHADYATRSRNHWLFSTGAGFALIAGAILGLVVGTVIVAQTLYASTKDHIAEFATLRAIGSTAGYIHKVILCQALISAAIGFSVAALAGHSDDVSDRRSRAAGHRHAATAGHAARADGRDVRRLGARRDCESHAHRSGRGVRAMSAPVVEVKGIVKELGEGAGAVLALKGVDLSVHAGRTDLADGAVGQRQDDACCRSSAACCRRPRAPSRSPAVSTARLGPEALAAVRRDHVGFVFQSFHLFPTLDRAGKRAARARRARRTQRRRGQTRP